MLIRFAKEEDLNMVNELALAKVLKVVKPPQKPVTKNSLRFGKSVPHLRNIPEKIPMQRQPRMFATNVGHGKPAALGITSERK